MAEQVENYQESLALSEESSEAVDEAVIWLRSYDGCLCRNCRFMHRLCMALCEATGTAMPVLH